MLTPAQYTQLGADIKADTGNLAATIGTTMAYLTGPTVTADGVIANLYNTVSVDNSIAVISITRDDLLYALSAPILAVLTDQAAQVAKSAKYGPVLQMLNMLTVIQMDNASLTTVFTDLVTDGYATSAQITAITNRSGSRAELLFGAGTVLDHYDVAVSLGRG